MIIKIFVLLCQVILLVASSNNNLVSNSITSNEDFVRVFEVQNAVDRVILQQTDWKKVDQLAEQILLRVKLVRKYIDSFVDDPFAWKFNAILCYTKKKQLEGFRKIPHTLLMSLLQVLSMIPGEEEFFFDLVKADRWKTFKHASDIMSIKDLKRLATHLLIKENIAGMSKAQFKRSDLYSMLKSCNWPRRRAIKSEMYAVGCFIESDFRDYEDDFDIAAFLESFSVYKERTAQEMDTLYVLNSSVIEAKQLDKNYQVLNFIRYGRGLMNSRLVRIGTDSDWKNNFAIAAYLRGSMKVFHTINELTFKVTEEVMRALLARPKYLHTIPLSKFDPAEFRKFFRMACEMGVISDSNVYGWFVKHREHCNLTRLLTTDLVEFKNALFIGHIRLSHILEFIKLVQVGNNFMAAFMSSISSIQIDVESIKLKQFIPYVEEEHFQRFFDVISAHLKFSDPVQDIFEFLKNEKSAAFLREGTNKMTFKNCLRRKYIDLERLQFSNVFFLIKDKADLLMILDILSMSEYFFFELFSDYVDINHSEDNFKLLESSFKILLGLFFEMRPLQALKTLPDCYLYNLIKNNEQQFTKFITDLSIETPCEQLPGLLTDLGYDNGLPVIRVSLNSEKDDTTFVKQIANLLCMINRFNYQIVIDTFMVIQLKGIPFKIDATKPIRMSCRTCGRISMTATKRVHTYEGVFRFIRPQSMTEHTCCHLSCRKLLATY